MTLTPSERITLMKEVSRRLAAEEYPLIDITLKQFSLPWSNEWEGTREEYVWTGDALEMLTFAGLVRDEREDQGKSSYVQERRDSR